MAEKASKSKTSKVNVEAGHKYAPVPSKTREVANGWMNVDTEADDDIDGPTDDERTEAVKFDAVTLVANPATGHKRSRASSNMEDALHVLAVVIAEVRLFCPRFGIVPPSPIKKAWPRRLPAFF